MRSMGVYCGQERFRNSSTSPSGRHGHAFDVKRLYPLCRGTAYDTWHPPPSLPDTLSITLHGIDRSPFFSGPHEYGTTGEAWKVSRGWRSWGRGR